MLRRATAPLILLVSLLLVGDAIAQQSVTVREINAIPQANIDQLNAFGLNLSSGDINPSFCTGLLYDGTLCGQNVKFTAVVLSDPLDSGLASVSNGSVGRIHIFVRDITALTEGNEGHGIQVVDGSNAFGLEGLLIGDVIEIVGSVSPFFTTMQITPTSITVTGQFIDPSGDSPIFDPIPATTADLNMDMGPNGAIQVNWDNLANVRGNLVRIEDATILTRSVGDRSDWNFTTDANPNTGGTSVAIYDTSIRYRNDKSDYPDNFNKHTIPFVPPVPGSTINIQGFVTYNGATSSDPFSLGVPNGTALAINPMKDADLEILEEPIKVQNTLLAAVPGSTEEGVITADIIVAAGRAISSAKIKYQTDLDATVLSKNPSAFSGVSYTFKIPAQPDGAFVSFWIEATDNGGGSFTTEERQYRSLDGGITQIEDIQKTLDEVEGPSPFEGWTVDVDIHAVVMWQRGRSGEGFIQDGDNTTSWSGVFFRENSLGAEAVGTKVHITRLRVEETFGLTRLRDVTYTADGSTTIYAPKVVSTTALGDSDIAEAHEGMYLRLENVFITATNADAPTGPFGEFNVASPNSNVSLRVDDLSSQLEYTSQDPGSVFAEFQQLEFVQGPLTYSFSNFKLEPQTFGDIGPVINVGVDENDVPNSFSLAQNYPNPFNPSTTINFELNATAYVTLEVFDTLGRRVAMLVDGQRFAGTHSVQFNASELSSGVYIYRISTGAQTQFKKMMLLK